MGTLDDLRAQLRAGPPQETKPAIEFWDGSHIHTKEELAKTPYGDMQKQWRIHILNFEREAFRLNTKCEGFAGDCRHIKTDGSTAPRTQPFPSYGNIPESTLKRRSESSEALLFTGGAKAHRFLCLECSREYADALDYLRRVRGEITPADIRSVEFSLERKKEPF